MSSANGYIYCFSNPSMPGLLLVGKTKSTPLIILGEANASGTWGPPTLYKIEFAKKVSDASGKLKNLHTLLEQYTERIDHSRDFFRVSPEEVRKLCDLMDGEMWAETRVVKEDEEEDEEEEEEEEEDEEEEDTSSESATRVKPTSVKTNRKRDYMVKCFTNGQRIRHIIGINKAWVGIYDSSKNGIIFDGKTYNTLSGMAKAHQKMELPHRLSNTASGWRECHCEVDGKWISTNNL